MSKILGLLDCWIVGTVVDAESEHKQNARVEGFPFGGGYLGSPLVAQPCPQHSAAFEWGTVEAIYRTTAPR